MKSIREIAHERGYTDELISKYCNCVDVGRPCLFCGLMQLTQGFPDTDPTPTA